MRQRGLGVEDGDLEPFFAVCMPVLSNLRPYLVLLHQLKLLAFTEGRLPVGE